MKKYAYLIAAAVAVLACTKENNPATEPKPVEPQPLVEMTFGASLEENVSPSSRAAISKENKTVWTSSDKISVFDGEKKNCEFSSNGDGETVKFSGAAASAKTYYALYPYQTEAKFSDDGKISAKVPDVQKATKGSFDPAAALMVAQGSESFEFKNVCSLIKVTVPDGVTGVTSIEFSGNKDEKIAGEVSISFDKQGLPTFEGAASTTIVLKAAEGTTLAAGDYYIAALPNTYSQGLKLLIHYENGMFQQAKATGDLTVARSAVRPVGSVKWPEVVFLGADDVVLAENLEVNTAVQWMIYNINNSAYVPLTALNETVLSNCSVVWWHYHRDWSVNSVDNFKSYTGISEDNISTLKNWYKNGGSMFLSRYAVYLANVLEINNAVPDHHWGGTEAGESGWTVSDDQYFYCAESNIKDSPYFNACAMKQDDTDERKVYTFEPNYYLTNSTCHYDEVDFATWSANTGNTVRAKSSGARQVVVGWECPSSNGSGLVFCLGTPLYDWYTKEGQWLWKDNSLHNNVMKITSTAIEYLKSK